MNEHTFSTQKGRFLVFDLAPQIKEFTHGGKTKLTHEGNQIEGIGFIHELTNDDCLQIVERYGPFGEYKGSRHPNGGHMQFRAYGEPLTALKDILKAEGIEFVNGYLFRIKTEK